MAGTPAVTDLLRACDSEAPQPSFRHLQSRAWLGVAVDNVVAAGDPMTVVAEVLGGPAGEATQMWVRVVGAGRTDNFRCERAGDQWRVELPGQRAGMYSLAVSATSVPGVGQLRCRDMLEVVALP
jgi:hypothetical protein